MDAQLTHAVSHRFYIPKMPKFQALQPDGYILLRTLFMQIVEPGREGVCLPYYADTHM